MVYFSDAGVKCFIVDAFSEGLQWGEMGITLSGMYDCSNRWKVADQVQSLTV